MMLPFLMAAVLAGEPSTKARTVAYRLEDIIPISAQVGLVTEVHLPKGETIMTDAAHGIRVGNKKFFQVNASGNVLYIEPMDDPEVGGGLKTTVSVSLASGEHVGFLVQEISKQKGAHADLKVFVKETDDSNIVAGGEPYIPVSEVERRLQAMTEKTEKLSDVMARMRPVKAEANDRKHCYDVIQTKGEKGVEPEIYIENGFTYVELHTQELPSFFEIVDSKHGKGGKRKVVQSVYASGRYEIPKLIEVGELMVGKSIVRFRKRG